MDRSLPGLARVEPITSERKRLDTSRSSIIGEPDEGVGEALCKVKEVPLKTKHDATLARIEAYNRERGGGVSVQKAGRGYTLVWEKAGRPVARLCPTGKGDQFEIKWWRRESWGQIGDFGPFLMPLDEALDYIARDPMGCFWY
jgi:hypothetical protein